MPMRDRHSAQTVFAAQLVLLIMIFVLWWGLVKTGVLPTFFFGDPIQVFERIWHWFATGSIWIHLGNTLLETILSFVIGTVAGIIPSLFPNGIPYASYDTWNLGIGFTYKVFTLDLRYSDTDLNKGNCSAFTSAFNASGTSNVTPINPGGTGSNWCGAAGIAKLSVDLTAATNLK